MKIGVVAEICNAKSGARAPIELAKALAKNNQVTFYATNQNLDPGVQKDLEKNNVRVNLLKTNSTPLIGRWLTSLKVRKLIRLDQPQILSTHCMLPLLIGTKLTRLPAISTYYGTQLDAYLEKLLPYQKPSLKDKLLNWLANQIILFIQKIHFKLANQTTAISQYTSQEAQNLYNRTIPHIYLGSNFPTDLLKAKSLPRTVPKGLVRGCQLKAINILSISRFTPYKGFHHLIKTFNELSKQHRNLKLILAGSLGSQKYLDYLKEIANDKVSFIINCGDEKLAQLYQASDIYATCDRYLFFGMPILEAASFGKPLLALNFCAANEVVQHKKTGFVANNLREFNSYLEKLIQNQKLRDTLGKNAQKRALHEFTWGKTAEKYQEVFESL